MKEENFSYYVKKANSLDKTKRRDKTVKIALLSSFTVKGLKEVLKVKCDDISIDADIYEADYNQINQEIINISSKLSKFQPNITYVLIDLKYVFGNSNLEFLQDKNKRLKSIKEKTQEFIGLIKTFTENFTGLVVISNLRNISYSPLGINEEKTEISKKDLVNYFNTKLKEEFINNQRVFVYDFASFFSKYGEFNIIDPKLYYLGDIIIRPDYLSHLAEDLMSYVKPYCSKNKKCIVLDLDNTLWGGIVGEDGFNNIKLDNKTLGNAFFEFQKKILELHKRGVILAINSKNNPEDALKVIRGHPYMVLREENFAALRINWNNKITNMKEIAKEINIGTDSLIFIDDDPMNRAMVREMMPEVMVIDLPEDPALYVRTLEQINDLNTLQITEEDFKRGKIYHQQRKRKELKYQSTDIDDFLKNLNMEIELAKANNFTIPRISQLTQKTNQFNLTTRRYTEEDIKKFVSSPDYLVYVVNVKDKFGDNGLTGCFIIDKESKEKWIIDVFLLSCRIIGRKVEDVMINYIKKLAQKEKIRELIGEYIPTKKNMQTASFYKDNGFDILSQNKFILKNPKLLKSIDFIKVKVKGG